MICLLFKATSTLAITRAAEALKDDLGSMGPARLSDVEGAQQEIVNVARRLEAEGRIIISRGGSDDALV